MKYDRLEEQKVCNGHQYPVAILTVVQSPITDDSSDTFDFLDIPMDGIEELNELDKYLLQALEKTQDPIAWWWEHRSVFP